MESREAIMRRRSIRAFKVDPVPKSVIQEILRTALWAPSWGNTQPWQFTVVGGKTLKNMAEKMIERIAQGAPPGPDLEMPSKWNESQTVRYKALGRDLFASLPISRGDKQGRSEHYLYMARLFGAPNLILAHTDKDFNQYALLDMGIVLQTIAILATDIGLGTCFLAQSVIYPDVIRQHVRIPGTNKIVMGLAMGYPIVDSPANLFSRSRGELQEFVTCEDVQ